MGKRERGGGAREKEREQSWNGKAVRLHDEVAEGKDEAESGLAGFASIVEPRSGVSRDNRGPVGPGGRLPRVRRHESASVDRVHLRPYESKLNAPFAARFSVSSSSPRLRPILEHDIDTRQPAANLPGLPPRGFTGTSVHDRDGRTDVRADQRATAAVNEIASFRDVLPSRANEA